MTPKVRVCVIGAGVAGLCTLKNVLSHNDMEVVAYERKSELGGTWVYSDVDPDVKINEDIHNSMYEGLRTNLPKEVMGFNDFEFPDDIEESFVDASVVLKFLQSYAKHFNLLPHIKLLHDVIRVRPWNGMWEVYLHDIGEKKHDVKHFDLLFVCNGHYSVPQYPILEGLDIYRGTKSHSHLYRKAEAFKGAKVLIIGVGASGMDITNLIHHVAKHVYLSHHLNPAPNTSFMPNVTQKPDVKNFTENGAIFKDGTSETFEFVLFCTGYNYSFPFLSVDCGIRITNNFVNPLYKHIININNPTMAMIGIPFLILPSQLCDLQSRFALKFFTKQKELPSYEEMMADMRREMDERLENGLTERKSHQMGPRQFAYYKELAETAEITEIKPVIAKIMASNRKYIYELNTFRNFCYRVTDDENFIKFELKKF